MRKLLLKLAVRILVSTLLSQKDFVARLGKKVYTVSGGVVQVGLSHGPGTVNTLRGELLTYTSRDMILIVSPVGSGLLSDELVS